MSRETAPARASSGPVRVRMESPDALFSPDHYVETPVPAPLYLLNCLRLPLETGYQMREDGTVANPAHSFQRNELVYPDGSRFWAEVSGSPTLGLPNVYDLDYLLGLIRIADQEGMEPDGQLPGMTYARAIRATRAESSVTKRQVQSVKRALARWANTSIRTAMEMVVDADGARAGNPARLPVRRPGRREREATHWVLEYDWESEQHGSSSRDIIGMLRLNPIWRLQTDLGIAAWIDVEIHNALHSALAKGIYLRLVLAAAQGQLSSTRIAPMQRWIEVLGVESNDKANKVAARFSEALGTLRKLGVLSVAEVYSPRRGEYELALEPGAPVTELVAARGIGSLDPVRTRTLVWHLGQLGFTAGEARALLGKHGMEVQGVLQRVHYERTVKGGLDSRGEPVLRWALWVGKALRENWKFEEPEYQSWLATQESRLLGAPGESSRPQVQAGTPLARGTADAAAADADVPASQPVEVSLPNNVWGEALARIRGDLSAEAFRTWLLPTWLVEVTEEEVQVGTTNTFAPSWIAEKYSPRLEKELSDLLGRTVRLRVEAQSEPSIR